jgi:membrane protease subunit HflC
MKTLPFILVLVIITVIFLASTFFIVTETQQAVITEFGKPIREIRTPGLYTKTPFIQKAHYFDDRLLEWDGYPTEIPTLDKKYIWVDSFARWHITNPLKFLQSVRNEQGAHARLDDIIDSAVRNQITSNILLEAIRSSNRPMATEIGTEGEESAIVEIEKISVGRDGITSAILKEAQTITSQYGIELVDVRIKRINYVETVRRKVYDRMIAERKQMAEKYRSEGQALRMEILGKKERELKTILSEAYRKSEEIKGKADGEATKIYADAYNRDPEFYSFLRTMETYKDTLKQNSWLILTTEADYLKYLKQLSPALEH